ncbi:uncharacterized protein K02A2.6-like [Toxorhynchites rutilus septentrionalis]|uniref:uncharacterized protein K02A2.6-like n=1 Tax=Toxorhynchites rutilus septentrionalis TaxID=329112 RepID=UPI00247B0DE6|nr:uncharacterized protein K02A2.6-like [Toxorhynchites rutilus septentrionalis]
MHLKTAPFHPQSNGQAERFVDTFKRTVKKIQAGGEDLDEALDIFLCCYRSTPCRSAPGGKSPAEILLGRPMRTSLELLRPPSKFTKLENSKQDRQFNSKHGAREKNFGVRDKVYAQVHQGNNWSWVAGEIVERIGRVIYNVWLPERQRLIRSHSNQLRKRHGDCIGEPEQAEQAIPLDILLDTWGLKPSEDCAAHGVASGTPPPPEPEGLGDLQQEFLRELIEPPSQQRRSRVPLRVPDANEPLLRRSSRQRHTPVRYEPYQLF